MGIDTKTSSKKTDGLQPFPPKAGGPRAVLVLYVAFFLMWCAGLLWGIAGKTGMTPLWGLPLWFWLSCVAAYLVVSLVLVWVGRRYFS